MSQFDAPDHEESNAARKIPRGEKRRRELAMIAERVFFERGFSATTMQMIASAAGASKETLYRHFTSKEALFAEIVRARASQFIGFEGDVPAGRPEKVLATLAANILTQMTASAGMSLLRVVVAEASRAPELGEIFYSQGPADVMARLTRYLRSIQRRGLIRRCDPRQAARLFLGATIADFHLARLTLPETAPMSKKDIDAHVRGVIEMFFARYGASGDPA